MIDLAPSGRDMPAFLKLDDRLLQEPRRSGGTTEAAIVACNASPALLQLLADILDDEARDVIACRQGDEALRLIRTAKPDLAILEGQERIRMASTHHAPYGRALRPKVSYTADSVGMPASCGHTRVRRRRQSPATGSAERARRRFEPKHGVWRYDPNEPACASPNSTRSRATVDNVPEMPYRDPEQRTAYQREYKRLKRAGDCQTPGQTLIPAPFRLKTAHDVLALLGEQVQAVRDEPEAGTLEKARCIGYLADVALRAIEAGDLSARLEALEAVLKARRVS